MYKPPEGVVFYDPYTAYRRDNGDRPIGLRLDRELWRDSASLFHFAEGDEFKAPDNLAQIAHLISRGILPRQSKYVASVLGASLDNARVLLWRHERLPLPLEYLADIDLVHDLKKALVVAEDVSNDALWSATRRMAAVALSPLDPTKADPSRVRAMIDSLAPERLYWSRLEQPFHRLLATLPGDAGHRLAEIRKWFEKVLRPTVKDAFHKTVGELDRSARVLRAAVEGEQRLCFELDKIERKHNLVKQQEATHADPG
jgi:CRISPR system Cascade subunit CasA